MDELGTDDAEFKKNYSKEVLSRTTTLRLKASFHLINYIMMSVCDSMLRKVSKGSSSQDSDDALPGPSDDLDELE